MPLTDKQRVAFFKLARRAYSVQQPDQPFDLWRKYEMREAGLKDSIKKVSKIIGYDTLMLHFAILAQDIDLVNYYQANEARLLLHIIDGLTKDLNWIANRISNGIATCEYSRDVSHLPPVKIRSIMQEMGDMVLELCADHDINHGLLPTASSPYNFRGKRAAAFAEYLNRKTGTKKRKEDRKEQIA